ncbi:hypothetical protein VR44_36530 [Streptomyces katrae]|uniref:Uncharacterized protein n=1 Tax=Streptomyces katrae TaxID=68223 RepID=A0A0F4IRD1_9ACTN|nr:hypothetical protein [Streptomyces katrae]KJY24028.1 hypothetical protein VR44_36530 [Streptomyces katrae]
MAIASSRPASAGAVDVLLGGQRDGADEFQQLGDGHPRAHGVCLSGARKEGVTGIGDHVVAGLSA